MSSTTLLDRVLEWRARRISDRQFVIILSVLVGLTVGISAVIIKNLVHLISALLSTIASHYGQFLYIVFPAVGILLVLVFINYILKRRIGHGIPSVLYAISKDKGLIKEHNIFSSVIASSLTSTMSMLRYFLYKLPKFFGNIHLTSK